MTTPAYVFLNKTTLSGSTSSVTINNINQNYTDLVFIADYDNSSQAGNRIRFNNDTSAIYDSTHMLGFEGQELAGSSNGNGEFSNEVGDAGNHLVIIRVFNYSDTSKLKTVHISTDHTNGRSAIEREVGLYKSNNAITSITLARSGGSMLAGGTFTLYGIEA